MKKLSECTRELIKDLNKKGLSSRQIAKALGIGKSTVNDTLSREGNTVKAQPKGYKVGLLDLETSADIVATFGRRQVNIGESNIVHQGNTIITGAWKLAGEDYIEASFTKWDKFKQNEETEKYLVEQLIYFLQKIDAVVIHNARFDLGTIQQRALHFGYGRLPTVKVIDTLQMARKYLQLRSNKLDSITKYFGLSNKLQNDGISLWIDVQSGCTESIKKMLDYNIQDVIALEEVYNKFKPLNSGVSVAVLNHDDCKLTCPSCGGHNVEPTGRHVHTNASAFEEYHCNDCGAKSRGRISVLTKEKRRSLLMPV